MKVAMEQTECEQNTIIDEISNEILFEKKHERHAVTAPVDIQSLKHQKID